MRDDRGVKRAAVRKLRHELGLENVSLHPGDIGGITVVAESRCALRYHWMT